ncbi:hypothetical protein V6N13_035641 [Hibiscus sabdariffa]|uniref:Uncharacterized protein n=1 Tax=Hibiscus sabdariffa TaxID=183260 RepID=A0ABR2S9G7_9ROSI
MEATQKKGFFRGTLAKSFSRFAKPRPTSTSSRVVPCSTQPSSSYSSMPRVSTYSYASWKQLATTFHEQKIDFADVPSSMQKVSYGSATEAWGHADEKVDLKASTYISNVRQRFQHDRV